MNKVVENAEIAIQGIKDNMTLMAHHERLGEPWIFSIKMIVR